MSELRDAETEVLKKLNLEWMNAYTKRDTAFLERYMSDDYVGTFPDGTVHDKKSEIEAVMSGAVAITEMTPSEMKVRVYRDAAVMTGQSTIKARVNDQNVSDQFRFTDVWIKFGEHWRAVASQVTRVENP
jgi:ketosteroid isomerase-like protein